MFDTNRETRPTASTALERVTRRRLLQGLTALVCAVGVPRWVLAVRQEGAPAFFTADELVFVTVLADTLIPKTDTAGAKEAGVPAGFEGLMLGWASNERRAAIQGAISALRDDLDRRVGGAFVSASADSRLQALAALDAEAFAPTSDRYGDYRDIKALMVRLYYASKPGATLELRYDPVPGGYDGDVPLAEIERAWASVEPGWQ